jgi:hypothetical protein
MALVKYVKQGGAWREVSEEYVKVGGTWRLVTSNCAKVGGAWVEIPIGEKSIFVCESYGGGGAPRLYGIDKNLDEIWHAALTTTSQVCCDSSGNSYWVCGSLLTSYDVAGVNRWNYSPGTGTFLSVCVDASGGVYCGESTGTVRRLNAATGALVWAKTPSAACIPAALAVNNATGRLYAVTSGTTRLYSFITSNGNYSILTPFSAWTGAGSAIAIDSVSTDLIIGESNGRLRRVRLSDLCEEWIQSNVGTIVRALQVGHDGFLYAAFGTIGNARKITLATGGAVWNYSNTADSTDIYGITADVSGNVYATWARTIGLTSANNLVRRLSSAGAVVDSWQPYLSACFKGIAVTPGHRAAGY